jgi:hypothetical protein
MEKPIITNFQTLGTLLIQRYERYIPNAFDESMSLVQKVNKVIMYLDQIGELTNDVVDQWNKVVEWLLEDGLTDAVETAFENLANSGEFVELVQDALDKLVSETSEHLHDIGINIKKPPSPYVGVKMDGVTDDSNAFQELVNAFPNRKLIVPNRGTLLIKTPIVTDQQLILEGELGTLPNIYGGSQNFSKIKYTGIGTLLQIDGRTKTADKIHPSGSTIRNLIIEGNSQATSGLKINERELTDTEMRNITLENVFFYGFRNGWAFEIHNSYSNILTNVNVEDCGGIGLLVNAHATVFMGGSLEQSAFGLYVKNSRPVSFVGTTIEGILSTRPNCSIPSSGFIPWTGWINSDNPRLSVAEYEGIGVVAFGSQIVWDGVYTEANDWDIVGELDSHISVSNSYLEGVAGSKGSINFAGAYISLSGNQFVNESSNKRIYVEPSVPPNYAYIVGNRKVNIGAGKLINTGFDYAGVVESEEYWGRTIEYKNTTLKAKLVTGDLIEAPVIKSPYFDVEVALRRGEESFLQFDPTYMYAYKPFVMDNSTYIRLGKQEPVNPAGGDIYFDDVAKAFKGFNGTSWVTL